MGPPSPEPPPSYASSDRIISTTLKQNDSTIGDRRKIIAMAILTFVNILNYMDRYSVSGVLTKLQDFFDIDDGSGGLLQTVYLFSYLIMAPGLGMLGDRWKRKAIMLTGNGIWILLMLATSFVPKNMFWLFIGLRGFIGIGDAAFMVVAPALICDLFHGNARSRALMIFYFAVPVGSGAGFVVSSSVADAMGGQWQWGLRAIPAAAIVGWLLLLVFVPEPARGTADNALAEQSNRNSIGDDIRQLAKTPTFIFVSFGVAAANFVTGALAWWVTAMISHAAEMPNTHIQTNATERQMIFGAIICISGAFGTFLGVYSSQLWREGRTCLPASERAQPLSCAIYTACAVPFLIASTHLIPVNLIWSYLAAFVAITLSCVSWAVTTDMIMAVVVPSRRSIAIGVHNTVAHIVGDGPAPYIVGLLSDIIRRHDDSPSGHFYSLLTAFYVPDAVMFICTGMFFFASLYYVRDKAAASEQMRRDTIISRPSYETDDGNPTAMKIEKF